MVFANYAVEHSVKREMEPLVLVVDDERHIVALLTELLEDEGYHVMSAYDGVDALELVRAHAPDLVLADIMMPRLDGLALLSSLHESNATLPVVLMSAAVTPLTHEVPYISKPFDLEELLNVLAHELAGRHGTNPSST